MAKTPGIGTPAPDFTLPAVEVVGGEARRGERTLSAQRGRPVVLAFYPGDDTPVCTRQLCAYTTELTEFTDLDAVVWGISAQDLASHEAFARKHSLGFPLLSDIDRAVTSAYGVSLLGVGTRRSVFVIDAAGVLRWKFVALVGLTYPDAAMIASQIPR
jgi:thioredoxin-dependent peroxiredoxin